MIPLYLGKVLGICVSRSSFISIPLQKKYKLLVSLVVAGTLSLYPLQFQIPLTFENVYWSSQTAAFEALHHSIMEFHIRVFGFTDPQSRLGGILSVAKEVQTASFAKERTP